MLARMSFGLSSKVRRTPASPSRTPCASVWSGEDGLAGSSASDHQRRTSAREAPAERLVQPGNAGPHPLEYRSSAHAFSPVPRSPRAARTRPRSASVSEGFLEQEGARLQDPAMRDDVVRVARHVEHPELGARGHQGFGQRPTVHPRHHDVGDEQVDGLRMAVGDLDGFVGTGGFDHPIAVFLENLASDDPQGTFVLDQQDRLPPSRGHRRFLDLRRHGWFVDTRQIDLERGASPHFAVHPDMATGLLHDAVHHRQAQAGALPLLLGREEGLEDLGQDLLLDPAAGVADGQHHVAARRHGLVSGGMARVQLGVGGLDAQQSPVGHGVPGVHAQVHHHLLQLPRVGLHPAEVRAGNDREVDVLADQASQHLLQIRQEGVEVQHFRVHDLLPAERQELAGETGGTLRGLQDLLELAPLRLARLAHQELGVPQDDAQRVVEVVGDTARPGGRPPPSSAPAATAPRAACAPSGPRGPRC